MKTTIRKVMKVISNVQADYIVMTGPCKDITIVTEISALKHCKITSNIRGILLDWSPSVREQVALYQYENGFIVHEKLRPDEMVNIIFEFLMWGEHLKTEIYCTVLRSMRSFPDRKDK